MTAALQTQREQRLPMKSNVNFVQKKQNKVPFSKKGEDGNGKPASSCASCGGSHDRQTCKFKDAVCRFCKNKGHIESVCITKKKGFSGNRGSTPSTGKPARRPNVRAVECSDPLPQINSFYIQNVSLDATARRYMVDIKINDVTFSAQMDNGADITLLSSTDYALIGSPPLTGASVSAHAANGNELKMIGSFKAYVSFDRDNRLLEFHVTDIQNTLLGTDFFKAFDIKLVRDGKLLCNMVTDNATAPAIVTEVLMKKFAPLFQPERFDTCIHTGTPTFPPCF
uniref:Peptidase A2 domain-containing protein n=1 Tax=Panagrolaimus superbus TaxID=310955 RepID=A0A914ZCC2_9BILA